MHSLEIILLWDRPPCVLVDTYHCFGGTCREKLRSLAQFWLEDFKGNPVGNQVYILAWWWSRSLKIAGLQSSAMETSYQVMENASSFWCETKHKISHCETENTETDYGNLCVKW